MGAEVRLARKALGWTLDNLASEAGVSKGYISQLENGLRNPSVEKLMGLARTLGTTVSCLLGEPPLNLTGKRVSFVSVTSKTVTLSFETGELTTFSLCL